jgi:hypothetical protein
MSGPVVRYFNFGSKTIISKENCMNLAVYDQLLKHKMDTFYCPKKGQFVPCEKIVNGNVVTISFENGSRVVITGEISGERDIDFCLLGSEAIFRMDAGEVQEYTLTREFTLTKHTKRQLKFMTYNYTKGVCMVEKDEIKVDVGEFDITGEGKCHLKYEF